VTALIQGVTALTLGQLEASERERKKSSVLSGLSRRQTFLFDALSASDWRNGNPKWTKEADMILEDRDVERNWDLMIDLTEKWPGGVSKPALYDGFAMPIPKLSVHKLRGAMVQPAGVTSQFTILENVCRTKKQRLKHDLTYAATFQGASVNSRIDMTKYPEIIYGWCFGRVIHFVVALRAEHPESHIFIAKYDFSDVYCRVAHTARAAAQTILVMGQVAYVMLRLAFGGPVK
jgi:hypothetical protein